MHAAFVDFDTRDGSMVLTGTVNLAEHGDFAGFAKATGFTEQVGRTPGTPWRNPSKGIVRLQIFESPNPGDCAERSAVINSTLNQIHAVRKYLADWDG